MASQAKTSVHSSTQRVDVDSTRVGCQDNSTTTFSTDNDPQRKTGNSLGVLHNHAGSSLQTCATTAPPPSWPRSWPPTARRLQPVLAIPGSEARQQADIDDHMSVTPQPSKFDDLHILSISTFNPSSGEAERRVVRPLASEPGGTAVRFPCGARELSPVYRADRDEHLTS
ncbi:hypothetical protein C0Q70_08388 [Pomacea canaliculata]|uniref:Uncharacterized protein n=1 Tax=Pomacea canaliculata TaxID=400727 RepID=A0A2T7PHP1_POMCA|nr:hypothetical protein C0Q70_08388 [Pomacea canaliculata]